MIDTAHPLPALLTTAEAAALARVTEATIRDWIAAGDLKAVRPSRRWLVKRDDLLRRLGLTRAQAA